MNILLAAESVIERVDGGPFDDGTEPEAADFHFNATLVGRVENRAVFKCAGCSAAVVLRGVVERGTVTCRRCDRTMTSGPTLRLVR